LYLLTLNKKKRYKIIFVKTQRVLTLLFSKKKKVNKINAIKRARFIA